MTNTFTCEINKSSHCSTQTRPDCKQATWNECREVPVKECKPKKIHVPTQELLHRKKCLLPDDIALSSAAGQWLVPVPAAMASCRCKTQSLSRGHLSFLA